VEDNLTARDVDLLEHTGLRLLQQISLGRVGYNHDAPKRTPDYGTIFKKSPGTPVVRVQIAVPTPATIQKVQNQVFGVRDGGVEHRKIKYRNWLRAFSLYGTLKKYSKWSVIFSYQHVLFMTICWFFITVQTQGAADGSTVRMPPDQITRLVQQLHFGGDFACLNASDVPFLKQFFR
jgi:hypothetical protein